MQKRQFTSYLNHKEETFSLEQTEEHPRVEGENRMVEGIGLVLGEIHELDFSILFKYVPR
jgi:hypothetical protein